MKKVLLALLVTIGAAYLFWPARTIQGPTSDIEFEYLVRVSAGGGSSDRLPMVISLHGDGGSPESFYEYLLKDIDYPARFVLLRGPRSVYGKDGWPRRDGGLREYGDSVADAVSVLLERYPTAGKPVALGFSSGGSYCYYLAAFHADKFSYVFPLAGNLPQDLIAKDSEPLSEETKVIAFHSKGDQIIRFQSGVAALDSLKQRGLDTEMVLYEGDHTDILSAKQVLYERLKGAMQDID